MNFAISDLIVPTIASVVANVTLVFLTRNWILERLKNSVKHEYDRRLESFRSDLQSSAAKRKDFIDRVTAERVKWLESLRQNISKFTGHVHSFWHLKEVEPNCPDARQLLMQIDVLGYLIRLQLNPNEEPDRLIESKLKLIPDLAAKSDFEPLKAAIDELVIEAQKLLKKEWNKVKEEAKHGDLNALLTNAGQLAA